MRNKRSETALELWNVISILLIIIIFSGCGTFRSKKITDKNVLTELNNNLFTASKEVKLLIKKGADVNIKDEKGYTALMLAAKSKNKFIVKLLKEAGAKK